MVGVINPPTDGSQNITDFATAAMALVNATGLETPTTVQGGAMVAVSTPSPSPSPSTKSAGVESRGAVQWGLLAFTGIVAAGFGGLLI